tara:strand:+ start:160 stop:486 length:327 start_codon:yes stop_codon:yes gene_type:complete
MPRSKKYTRKHMRTNKRRRRTKQKYSRKKSRSNRRRQRGGFNKNKYGSTTYLTMDKRYRPLGDVTDSIKYQGKKLVNNVTGRYNPVNPDVSKQPIGKPLSVGKFRFGQ